MRRIIVVAIVLVLATGTAFAAGRPETATPERLVVWAHSVHYEVGTGRTGAGINVSEQFEQEHGVEVEWITIPWTGMEEQIRRELTSPDVEPDIIFVNHNWADDDLVSHLLPLGSYMQSRPFEDADDIPEGLYAPFLRDGEAYGVPYRITLRALHYNARIFEEHGIAGPPQTIEELADIARRVTHRRDDGAQVYGLGVRMDQDELTILRAFGVDALSQDYEIGINSQEAVNAYSELRALYREGVIPPDFAVLDTATMQELVGEGLIAMAGFPDGYYMRFNDPEVSREAGNMEATAFPAASALNLPAAPSDTAIWAATMPAGGRENARDLSWDFLRHFASKDAQLAMALNGNAPVRSSTFVEPEYLNEVPYGETSSRVIQTASPALPTFAGTSEVRDIVREAAIEAITGTGAVQAVLNRAAGRIERVLAEHGVR